MSDAYMCFLALFASFGIISAVYLILNAWLKPKQREAFIFLVQPETADELFQNVQYARWIGQRLSLRIRLVVSAQKLDEEARRLAEIFVREHAVEILYPDEIGGYLWKNG